MTVAPDSDIRTWIASLTVKRIEAGIASAIQKRDRQAVEGLIKILAIKDPERAQVVYDVLVMATRTGGSRNG